MNVDHALTVLNRLASRNPDQKKRLEKALRGRLDSLAETSLKVGMETGEPRSPAYVRSYWGSPPAATTVFWCSCCISASKSR